MQLIITFVLFALVLIAGVTDIRTRRIPNWLVLSGLCLGVVLNSLLFQWSGLKLSLSGAALAFGIYLVLYLLRGMGAGDVKLMAAIGALVGPKDWLAIFFFTAMIGGVIALVLLLMKRRFKQTLFNVGIMLSQLLHFQAPYHATEELDVRSGKALRLPHGVSIALGTIAYVGIEFPQYRAWL
jgi:prepilin peptidase CpaA